MPFPFQKWSHWAEAFQSTDEHPANRISEIVEHLASSLAFIKGYNITSPSSIASILLPIDEMLQRWQQQLPSTWLPVSLRSPNDTMALFDSIFDRYPDLWIASVWNNYRGARILIHQMLMSSVRGNLASHETVSLDQSTKILHIMATEICRSVPYHLEQSGTAGQKCSSHPGGYLLTWPLYMAATLSTTSTECRMWIADRLHEIGIGLGLQLALSLSIDLRQRQATTSFLETEFWSYDA